MTNEQANQLEYPFQTNKIKWRISHKTQDNKSGLAVPYVNSRDVQSRLNDVLGKENWENKFMAIPSNGKDTTTYICEISIYYPDLDRWITKSDGAGSTEYEPVKGGLSESFKRAASMWGIGFYLYSFEGVWVNIKPKGKSFVIIKSEFSKLNKAYNDMIKVYLDGGARPGTSLAKQQFSARQPLSNQNVPIPNRRTSEVQKQSVETGQGQIASGPVAADQKTKILKYRITDAKTTRGGSGPQTFVSLQGNDGSAFTGYIKGDSVKTGQILMDLQVSKLHDDIAGNYNIINSYKIAA